MCGLFNPGTFDPLIRSVRLIGRRDQIMFGSIQANLVGFVELGEELDVGDKRVHLGKFNCRSVYSPLYRSTFIVIKDCYFWRILKIEPTL